MEILGLSGAINKRIFELNANPKYLEEAIWYYDRGFSLKQDYYNGINAAYMLYRKASIQKANADDEWEDTRTDADSTRNKVLKFRLLLKPVQALQNRATGYGYYLRLQRRIIIKGTPISKPRMSKSQSRSRRDGRQFCYKCLRRPKGKNRNDQTGFGAVITGSSGQGLIRKIIGYPACCPRGGFLRLPRRNDPGSHTSTAVPGYNRRAQKAGWTGSGIIASPSNRISPVTMRRITVLISAQHA